MVMVLEELRRVLIDDVAASLEQVTDCSWWLSAFSAHH